MVTLAKNWTFNVNNVATGTPEEQYQRLFLAVHETIKAAGYTVAYSSNGVVASAADNVTTIADVVQGDIASSPRTWILYDISPNVPDTVGTWQLIIQTETAGSTQVFKGLECYTDCLGFDPSAATVSVIPTPNSGAATALLDFVVDIRTADYDETYIETGWHAMWSDEGDVMFLTQESRTVSTDQFMNSIFVLRADTPARAGTDAGNLLMMLGWSGQSSTPIIDPSIATPSINKAGTANNTTLALTSSLGNFSHEEERRLCLLPIWLSATESGASRFLGRWTDVWETSYLLPYGMVEADDTDDVRLVHVMKQLMIPWPADEFPIARSS